MRETFCDIRLFVFRLPDIAVEFGRASNHSEALKDALRLFLVWVTSACVGVPDTVGQFAFENLKASNISRHEWDGMIKQIHDMQACSRADEIVSVRYNAALHLVEQVIKLAFTDIVKINHNRMQVTGVTAAAALAVIADRSQKHKRVLLNRQLSKLFKFFKTVMKRISMHDTFYKFVALWVYSSIYLLTGILKNNDVGLTIGIVTLLLESPIRKHGVIKGVGIAVGPTQMIRIEQLLIPHLVGMTLVLIPAAVMFTGTLTTLP